MVAELLAQPGTIAVVLSRRQGLVRAPACSWPGPASCTRPWWPPARDRSWWFISVRPFRTEICPKAPNCLLFVLPEPAVPGTAGIPRDAAWAGFRDVAAGLDRRHTALFVEASAITNWHALPHALPAVRHAHGGRGRRLGPAVPGGRLRTLSADRSCHHCDGGWPGRPPAAGRRRACGRQKLLHPGRLRGARRVAGAGGGPRDLSRRLASA